VVKTLEFPSPVGCHGAADAHCFDILEIPVQQVAVTSVKLLSCWIMDLKEQPASARSSKLHTVATVHSNSSLQYFYSKASKTSHALRQAKALSIVNTAHKSLSPQQPRSAAQPRKCNCSTPSQGTEPAALASEGVAGRSRKWPWEPRNGGRAPRKMGTAAPRAACTQHPMRHTIRSTDTAFVQPRHALCRCAAPRTECRSAAPGCSRRRRCASACVRYPPRRA
jgi:hypothetical protein